MPLKSLASSLLSIFNTKQDQVFELRDDDIKPLVAQALQEDLGKAGDITSKALIDPHQLAKGALIAKQDGVIAGLRCAELSFKLIEEGCAFSSHVSDGAFISAGTKLASIDGTARGLLAAERTALNFLGHLSGIATLTRQFVHAVAHTDARIRDTRKTTPGLRLLEKYAVHCGGGVNHRMGLYGAVLIKDNHLALAGRIGDVMEKLRTRIDPALAIEVEVDTLDQLDEALRAGVQTILLDNMSAAQMKIAVERTKGRAALEASGGITLENVRLVAETGVDFISCGALTHSAPSLDVSLEMNA